MESVWIRHAKKMYSNGHAPEGMPQHDSPICEDAHKDIREHFEYLLSIVCPPKIIYTSPFDRARETTDVLLSLLKERGEICSVEVDPVLGEYLGHQRPRGQYADVSWGTLSYIQPRLGVESIENLDNRVSKFLSNHAYDYKAWYVTHGIFISKIFQQKTGRKVKFRPLEGVLTKRGKYKIVKLKS
jgi:broad specificity phosphatase PhoE